MIRSGRNQTRLQRRVEQVLTSSQKSHFSDMERDQQDVDPENRERQARERILREQRLDKQAYVNT